MTSLHAGGCVHCMCMSFDVNVCGISGLNSFIGEECKTRENSIFLKWYKKSNFGRKSKIFLDSRMTKQTSPLKSFREI